MAHVAHVAAPQQAPVAHLAHRPLDVLSVLLEQRSPELLRTFFVAFGAGEAVRGWVGCQGFKF